MKKMFIIGAAALLLVTIFSGCVNIDTSSDREDTDDWSNSDDGFWNDNDWNEPDDDIWNNFWSAKTITISGIDTVRVVNYLDKPVKLVVSGIRNDVTITEETNLVDIILSGVDCIVRVSRSHSFTSMISGVGSEIAFYD